MLADGVEGASRALAEPTPSRIRGLVHAHHRGARAARGSSTSASLTLQELARIREAFIPVLTAIFHVRAPAPRPPSRPAKRESRVEARGVVALRAGAFAGGSFTRCAPRRRSWGSWPRMHPQEEVRVADVVLQPAAPHAGEHHAHGHEAGADGVVRRLVRRRVRSDHVQQVGGEPEAVAELLDARCRPGSTAQARAAGCTRGR